MGLLDTYLSDRERSILQKRRSKIAGSFFVLFVVVIVMSYIAQTQLSYEDGNTLSSSEIKNIKNGLIIGSILILAYLGWILFSLIKPTYISYLDLITDLLSIKNNVHKSDRQLSSRENTLLRFRELNYAVNNAVLYATIEDENRIAYISKKFEDYLGHDEDLTFRKFEEVLTYKHNQHHKIRKVLTNANDEMVSRELSLTNHKGEVYWVDMAIINMDNSKRSKRRLIVCTDITERKKYDLRVQKVNRDKFVKEVQFQKDLSQQIMSAQEDERKRIAKDIHDGIGQMLTALRFSIDGINLDDTNAAKESFTGLKEVFGQLIKDVRSVTFSLAPPELSDHGLAPALRKMSNVLSKITGIRVLYENVSEFDIRLEKNVEINIYRIVQEAVNNALKYAESSYILITLSHTDDFLSIKVEDDGKGFELKDVNFKAVGTGHGLRFMNERIDFVHGKLMLNSAPGKGTTIAVDIPLDEKNKRTV